jgi:hypothetical protein
MKKPPETDLDEDMPKEERQVTFDRVQNHLYYQ